MQELEKIIEKMKEIKDGNRKEKLYAKYPPNGRDQEALNAYSQGYEDGTDNFYNAIVDDVRKHMNDGWIPVEERLPTMEEYQKNDGRFILDNGGRRYMGYFDVYTGRFYYYRHITPYRAELYENDRIIAWCPLPDSYHPKPQNKPEDRYPEWRAKFLNKFDRRE